MSGEKSEDPTPHRLRDARRRGQVAVSSELNGATAFAAVVAYLLVQGEDIARQLRMLFHVILAHVRDVGQPLAAGTDQVLIEVGLVAARICLPPVLIGAIVAVATGVVQTRGLLAFEAAKGDLTRIDPINGLKQVFSVRSLLSLIKLVVGLAVIAAIVSVTFRDMLPAMMRSGYVPATQTVAVSWYFASRLIATGVLVAMLMAVADYLIQKYNYTSGLRMSKQEVFDEHKSVEGNPLVKSSQRQFFERLIDEVTQQQIEQSQVIVVNPTHVAIAIRYEPGKYDLPLIAAKGLDAAALAIRRYAEEVGVPIYESRSLARDLYRDCRTREYITHQYFEAIAEVFKWLAKMQGAKQMAQKAAVARGGLA